MKIISINLNGIRSAAKKKFFPWVEKQNPDLICLQEIRANSLQMNNPLFQLSGYDLYNVSAAKEGYSGVAIYSKNKPIEIINSLGIPCIENEGRYLQLNFKLFKLASIYMPSGTSGDHRQSIKFEFLNSYSKILVEQIKDPTPYIICGDFNIAHRNIDLKNWRSNQNSSGFLPEERAWLDHIFEHIGFIDTYRYKNPDQIEYTWWSNFANAWNNNVGWRIDYQIVSPTLKEKILNASIYRGEKFSDHAPVIVEYDF